MIEFTGTVSASFSASHVIKGHPRCGRLHGHRWRLVVTIKAGQDPETGDLVGLAELATAVERLAAELDREDIGAMVVGTPPTAAGIGLAFHERLSLTFRTIVRVQVEMDNVSTAINYS